MKKLTQKQAQKITSLCCRILDIQEQVKDILQSHEIIDDDDNASDELSDEARDAVETLINDGSADYLLDYIDEITK